MRLGGTVALVVSLLGPLVSACSRSSAPVMGAVPPGSPLDHLTAPATVVIGFNFHGRGAELGSFYAKAESKLAASGAKIPPCALTVVGKLEDGAFAYDPATKAGRIVVRGPGLRGAAETCLRTLLPDARIADEGNVTHYQLGKDGFYVLWLGDSLAIAAPDADAAASAALAETPAPILQDDRVRSLLGRVDSTQWYWFAADLTTLDLREAPFHPHAVWGTIEEKVMRVTLAFSSANEAAKLASLAKEFPRQGPPELQALLGDFSVDVHGMQTTFTLGFAKLLAAAGFDPKNVPPSVGPTFGLGVVAAVAIPAFMKNVKKAKSSEARMNLKKLYDGAFAQYGYAHELPASTGVTPPLGDCCKSKDGTCAPDATLWGTPAWKALRFSVDDPYRYSYEFKSDKSSFVARAYGDLNCDGTYSTFEMKGNIAADRTITTKGLVVDRELE